MDIYIYILEMINILSHLRGGLFIYWYWYLIPMYVLLVIRFNKCARTYTNTYNVTKT